MQTGVRVRKLQPVLAPSECGALLSVAAELPWYVNGAEALAGGGLWGYGILICYWLT